MTVTMRSDTSKRYHNYAQFYWRGGKDDTGRYRKYQRDCDKKFGPLLEGDLRRSVLDVGCADGKLVSFMKDKGFAEVVGIDLNRQLIERARENVDAEFIHGDAREILESGRHFDLIFLLNVLEHIERDRLVGFMSLVHQALKAGGFAIIRTPNMSNIMAAGHLADDLTHYTGLTEQSLQQLARTAGFGKIVMMDQFRMQNFKGKIKAVLNWGLHKWLWWLRGGTKPKVFYRNLYAKMVK